MWAALCLRGVVVSFLSTTFACCVLTLAVAQGLSQSPYSAPDAVRRGAAERGLDLLPSHPLGLPGGTPGVPQATDSVCLSDGMLRGLVPLIPNLQLACLYDFGSNKTSRARFIADYVLPVGLSADTTIFGEAHTEFDGFRNQAGSSERISMSLGAGYRTLLEHRTLLGINGFYDTARLDGTWHSSGGIGFEAAVLVAGGDAIDLNFAWYGQLFNQNVIRDAFSHGPSDFEVEAGYSHELWNGGPDLRLKITGYKFDLGDSVYGWNAGAELKSRDGVFVVRYDVGHDELEHAYQTIGGFVNAGLQLENLLKGENPLTMPEPIFDSPRSLRYMLVQPVKRNWHAPAAVILARSSAPRTMVGRSSLRGTATFSDATPRCVGTNRVVDLSPRINLSEAASFSSLAVTFSEPPPDEWGGSFQLFTDTGHSTLQVRVYHRSHSITVSKSDNPDLFGQIEGSTYSRMCITNSSRKSAWCAGTATLQWH